MDGLTAKFTSLDGGDALRQTIVSSFEEALQAAGGAALDIQIMMFAFTDVDLGYKLVDLARQNINARIRLIADWNQFSGRRGVVRSLSSLGLENLSVRFKADQPYWWDPERRALRWSYHVSWGLLHHRTALFRCAGRPWRLICGSGNWSQAAWHNYETLLSFDGAQRSFHPLFKSFEAEFEALWNNPGLTMSPEDAVRHFHLIAQQFGSAGSCSPHLVRGLLADDAATDCAPEMQSDNTGHAPTEVVRQPLLVAFNARKPGSPSSMPGYALSNASRRFLLRKPSGLEKAVPIQLTNLFLDFASRTRPGDVVKVAMYGISPRVAEFGRLLALARQGTSVDLVLDRRVSGSTARSLRNKALKERLPMRVRTIGRVMHQKYVVNASTGAVLSGSANMSTDAVERHSENRTLIYDAPNVVRRFLDDFECIWRRAGV